VGHVIGLIGISFSPKRQSDLTRGFYRSLYKLWDSTRYKCVQQQKYPFYGDEMFHQKESTNRLQHLENQVNPPRVKCTYLRIR
jgi:hypothetical protein